MQFTFTEEQEQFREMVRRFAADRSPVAEIRRLMATDDGYDPTVWARLAGELGLTALQIPERYGGAGFGPVEVGIVLEEFGRALLCAPYFSSAVLATRVILEAGSEADRETLLPGLADGSRRGAFALVEADGSWDPSGVATTAATSADGWQLNGRKRFVIDGQTADFLIVAARFDGQLALFRVATNADGVTVAPAAAMDPTRKLADVSLRDAPAVRLGGPGDATAAVDRAMDLAAVALASEMVGGAQALLESAVAYAKMRVQFGRTIGSFQAIKHKCADMLLDVESAKSAAYCAASALAENDPEAPALACLAKAAAADTYLRTAAETIQIHGGIGFTWENDTHLWFKRAKSSEVMLGDPAWHRERLMQRWGY
ncbi:MAG TPA: acyl-CoA dehydrogenase family protein [Pseudomonadales bacterium]